MFEKDLRIIKALSHKHKFSTWVILNKRKKGLTGTELAKKNNSSNSNMSHHLSAMIDVGIIREQREGKSIRYFANPIKLSIFRDR